MKANQTRSNYALDRSNNFKHQTPTDLLKAGTPQAHDYINNERCKQANQMRDWYIDASEKEQANLVELRTSFSTARGFKSPNPLQMLGRYKGFALATALIAGIIGGVMHFGGHL